MIYENTYNKKGVRCSISEKTTITKLDAYIMKCERKFGKISSLGILPKKQLQLVKLVRKLTEAIEKEEMNKQQAFQILKASNDAIKETISKLQDSMKMYKQNVKSEIAKLDYLSTDRLLNINYTCI